MVDKSAKVLNMRALGIFDVSHLDPSMVYIGRPSKWGNPFTIGKHGTREEVIELYCEWIRDQTELLKDLPELWGKDLVCWCAPAACHGDVLLSLLEENQLRNH